MNKYLICRVTAKNELKSKHLCRLIFFRGVRKQCTVCFCSDSIYHLFGDETASRSQGLVSKQCGRNGNLGKHLSPRICARWNPPLRIRDLTIQRIFSGLHANNMILLLSAESAVVQYRT
jgi:hypothetical protein